MSSFLFILALKSSDYYSLLITRIKSITLSFGANKENREDQQTGEFSCNSISVMMMAFSFNRRFWLSSSFLLILMPLSVSSLTTTFLSDSIFDSQVHTGRNLLQAKKGCSVNFEFLNYTIITSKCKGPHYPPKECCGAFKEFACPYVDVINDLTNDCASTMFSYINLYGKYPPGLFASECHEGKLGLECPALPPSASADDTANQVVHCPSLLLMLTACFLILLF